MNTKKETKSTLHPRNRHNKSYDFDALIEVLPELKKYVFTNKYNNSTIDFFDPEAVKALNKALLIKHYNIKDWRIPVGYLCPAIPGRADYIHYAADLIGSKKEAKVVDVGTGANCIYPLIGNYEYKWTFKAADVDKVAIENAREIVAKNKLEDSIECIIQTNPKEMFYGVITKDDYFDLTICNPPFFSSQLEAEKANKRKVKNLSNSINNTSRRNFGGQNNELWYKGGEKGFVKKMIKESSAFRENVNWFTVLVSNHKNLKSFEQALFNVKSKEEKVIEMRQGQKTSHILAWRF